MHAALYTASVRPLHIFALDVIALGNVMVGASTSQNKYYIPKARLVDPIKEHDGDSSLGIGMPIFLSR